MKCIIEDGKVFRYRRGKLVQVPPQWVGRITTKETIRQRNSKQIHKRRRGPPKPQRKIGIQK